MAAKNWNRAAFDPKKLLNGRAAGQARLHLAARQIVYRQADLPHALFYIEDGLVKISVLSPGGREAVTGVCYQGDFIGVGLLLSEDHHLGTAAALTDCVLISIGRPAMGRLLREEPAFADMFIDRLIRQHLRDQETLIDNLTNSAESRLARVLLRLSNAGGPIQIDQETLANMIGTTRPRVNSFMNKFRRNGLIDYGRQSSIIVRKALSRVLADT
jgi:CRP/FNR family transcriptional regulator, cyclic AMP receptor protein